MHDGPTMAGLHATMPPTARDLHTRARRGDLTDDERAAIDRQIEQVDADARAAAWARTQDRLDQAWRARLGPVSRAARLDTLHPQQDPGGVVSRWLDSGHLGLVLHGETRRGKTVAADAVGNEARRREATVLGWELPDLLAAIRSGYGDGTAEHLMDEVSTVDLLVLNDIAKTRVNEWALEAVWRILDARVRHRRRTVYTLNTQPGQRVDHVLAASFDSAVAERVGEDAVICRIEGRPLSGPVAP